jgi:hypothetical protein
MVTLLVSPIVSQHGGNKKTAASAAVFFDAEA